MTRAAFILAALLCSASHADETSATVAAGADTASTVIAVGSGIGVESNVLIASPPVFLAVSAIKLAAPSMTRNMVPEDRDLALRSMTTVWGGAAANNLALIAGAGCPPCVGIAAGVWLWMSSKKDQPMPQADVVNVAM